LLKMSLPQMKSHAAFSSMMTLLALVSASMVNRLKLGKNFGSLAFPRYFPA